MANNYKVLGQAAAAAATDTLLYTVPANTQTIGSSVAAANRDPAVTAAYRVAVVPSADSLNTKHYLRYDKLLAPRDDNQMVIGISLAAGDKVYVRSDTGNVSFSLFGNEITP